MSRPKHNNLVSSGADGGQGGGLGFANMHLMNQPLGVLKNTGPVKATATMHLDHPFHLGGSHSSAMVPAVAGQRKTMSATLKHKKMGAPGLDSNHGIRANVRVGSARKRPASPNTQALMHKGLNQPPYVYYQAQPLSHPQMLANQRAFASQKPGSAPFKNRLRQSPMNNEVPRHSS